MTEVALCFTRDGAEHFPAALDAATLAGLDSFADSLPSDRPGLRIRTAGVLSSVLAPSGPIGSIAAAKLAPSCRPVRAIMFDKSPSTNWSLSWHQDRTVAVAERIEVPGFRNWNVKHGMIHVEPPWSVIEHMLTMRIHLDAVPPDNAPLLIAPGSHRLGRIVESNISDIVERCGTAACLAGRGDVWLYATSILHASEAADRPFHRRVLQIDFAAVDLPGGLKWLGL